MFDNLHLPDGDTVLPGTSISLDDLMASVQREYKERADPAPPKSPTEDQQRISKLESEVIMLRSAMDALQGQMAHFCGQFGVRLPIGPKRD